MTLGVAAVARRLGVATGTLRTWDRRYGLGPSAHEAGTRRRYTTADLGRLVLMRRLMLEGAAAAEAAQVATTTRPRDLPDVGLLPSGQPPASRPGGRPGGGRVVPTGGGGPAARGLARAAMSRDGDAGTALLRSSISRSGVVATWSEVLAPVLAGVGARWRTSGSGIEVEHLLSESAETALRAVPPATRPRNSRPVLLAGLEAEDHRLPLVALAAALAERQIGARLLGVRLPVRALTDAVTRTGALAVFLWSQGAGAPGRLPAEAAFAGVRPRPALLLGGPGWDRGTGGLDRPGVSVVSDLEAAVAAVVAVGSAGAPAR